MLFFLLLAAAAAVNSQTTTDSKVVHIAQGPVRGYRWNGTDVFTFYGIPYATTPTGSQKFRPALPPPTWTETLEAIDHGVICIQPIGLNITGKTMQEDCLIANVYIPDTKETNLPVLVIFHGGAFQYGFGTLSEPLALVDTKRIIAVTFNYRLGAHGFLCLGTEDIPGNAGSKDQVMLLRWVKDNIADFGGNPEDITIAGCSAGGVSVDSMLVSKITEGLFKRAIAGSGAVTGSFGIQTDPTENAKMYARILDFEDVDDAHKLEEFYKATSVETLITRVDQVMNRPDSSVIFAPCVERETGGERFLDDAPINILRNRDLKRYPMIYDFADMEGRMRLNTFNLWKDMMNEKFSDFLPADLEFDSDEEREEVAATVKEFYFGNDPVGEDNILKFIDYFTDVLFAYSMLRSLKLHYEFGNNSVYLSEYSFTDENTDNIPFTTEKGANHCDQSIIVFYEDKTNLTNEYLDMKSTMRQIYLNFINTDEPAPAGSGIPSWPPANAERNPHMSIGSTLQLSGPLLQNRAEFWDDIYDRYYRTPIPPRNGASNMISTYTYIYFAFMFLLLRIFNFDGFSIHTDDD